MGYFNSHSLLGRKLGRFITGGKRFKETKAASEPEGNTEFSYSTVTLHPPDERYQEKHSRTLSTPKTIRLVKILSLDSDGLLNCQIHTVKLNRGQIPSYEALSYTWGPPAQAMIKNDVDAEKGRVIICNNKRLSVKENLFGCLMQLAQDGYYDRDLWIDAICIDQDNIDEINQQVSIMKDIYQCAKRVIIWLGADDDGSAQPALELMNGLTALSDEDMFTIIPQAYEDAHNKSLIGDANSKGHWKALALLFGRAWFTRVWVVQELVLARQTTVLCGKYTFDWESILSVSHFLAKKTSSNAFRSQKDGLNTGSLSYKNPAKLGAISRDLTTRPGDILLRCLIRCRTYQASKDHDKVYSLLGLVDFQRNGHHKLLPDYKKSVSEVYIETTELLLKNSDHLHVLAHAEGEDFKEVPGLPSWVVDWSVKEDVGLRITGYARYEAAGKLPCFKNIRGNGILALRGFQLDTITRIGETKAKVNSTEDCGDWLDLLRELEQESPERNHRDAFWRTLVIDTDPSEKVPVTQPWENAFDVWMNLCSHEPSPGETKRATEFETSFTHSLNLRLFRTAGGHLGCGTTSCREGDLIWIVQGSRVPLIFRPAERDSTAYNLVGGTYLHGFMQGEALEGREFQDVILV
ncbi:hypothetical protein M426DRAFT_257412 [Hypoxylon sp. CI-4A]|nr:hypothetical protein M426DRAFT_257412 [Hypoxylon sp. CI-4A]